MNYVEDDDKMQQGIAIIAEEVEKAYQQGWFFISFRYKKSTSMVLFHS
jgi:hypothetical protein